MADKELFKIESITERTSITKEGTFVKEMEVEYVTKSGVRGTVMLPKEGFTAEKAREAVKREAEEIEKTLG